MTKIKNTFFFILISFFAIAQDTTYVLAWGQSNTTGSNQADTLFTKNALDSKNNGKVYIANRYTSNIELWDLNDSLGQYGDALSTEPKPFVVGNSCPVFYFCRQLSNYTGNVVVAVMAARGGTKIEKWLTVENGGSATIWNNLIADVSTFNIDHFDIVFSLHGEANRGDINNGTYTSASTGNSGWKGYGDDVFTIYEELRDSLQLIDHTTPILHGMPRDFWHTSNVRVGGSGDGVRPFYEQFLKPSTDSNLTHGFNIRTVPTKDLPSWNDGNVDGNVHYSKRASIDIARYAITTLNNMSGENPLDTTGRTIYISKDTVVYISPLRGYFTGRINDTLNSWESFNNWMYKTYPAGGTVRAVIVDDIDMDGVDISYPNWNGGGFSIYGINSWQGSLSLTSDSVATYNAMKNNFQTKIFGNVTISSKVNMRYLLFDGSDDDGAGLTITSGAEFTATYLGVFGYNTGVNVTRNGLLLPSNFVYVTQANTYGVYATINGYANFTGTNRTSEFNGTNYKTATNGVISE